jgi:hypothetical protein
MLVPFPPIYSEKLTEKGIKECLNGKTIQGRVSNISMLVSYQIYRGLSILTMEMASKQA